MSSEEIRLTITPQQAKYGVITTVSLATGPARLRIPPSKDGDLVRARVGAAEVLVRIRVGPDAGVPASPTPPPTASRPPTASPTPPPNPAATPPPSARAPGPTSGAAFFGTPGVPTTGPGQTGPGPGSRPGGTPTARGCLVALGVVVALVVGAVVLTNVNDDDGPEAAPRPAPSFSASVWSPSPDPTPPPVVSTPTPPETPADTAATPSEEPAPTPFDRGTCLNGTLPDSTTAQRVTGVEEVSCSASDAHYRVIESIPLTSDLDRCNDNPKTEYAFSYRYTRNGIPINEYVYCLVGIGSYGR
ncbi:hypothetical protein [Streptomyces sp. ISL-66]|uniref:LppU/SCO3897 family protein n=1 Tax=Streptomyces sp. ISL-66 TaxID=2819186 RepID=UPI0020362B2C|nr:hypothetical protein [Streptomyces sp. ISL-66]